METVLESLRTSEEARFNYMQDRLSEWQKLDHQMRKSYIQHIEKLKGERRDIFKYLGLVAGGSAALAPQLLNEVLQSSLFYTGISLLTFVLIFCIIYVLTNIENETAVLIKSYEQDKDIIHKLKAEKVSYLKKGDNSLKFFLDNLTTESNDEVLKYFNERLNKKESKNWIHPMDYTGEFIVSFLSLA